MSMRKLVLGSAGSLVLAGALVASIPSSAQYTEETQTQQLNQQQTAPGTVAPAPADKAAYDAAQAQYNQAQAKYNAQVQEYNNKTRAYQTQRDAYTAKVTDYQGKVQVYSDQARRYDNDVVVVERAVPDAVVVESTAPSTVVVQQPAPAAPDVVVVQDPAPAPDVLVVNEVPDDFVARLVFPNPPLTLWRLDRYIDPSRELFNAPVLDAAGLPVGHFRRTEIKDPGVPVAVVTLNGALRTISIPLEHVRFDPNARVVIADMPANEINSIPSGFPYG
jgi:hypothetical protein